MKKLLLILMLFSLPVAFAGVVTDYCQAGDNVLNDNSLTITTINTGHENDEQSLYLVAKNSSTKAFIDWRDNSSGTMQKQGWLGCHNLTLSGDVHQHCSWESWDSDIGFYESKIVMSYGTPRNDSWVQISNVDHFKMGSEVDFRTWNGNIIGEGVLGVKIYGQNQTTYGLRVNNLSDGVQLEGTTSDEIYVNSDLNLLDGLYSYDVNFLQNDVTIGNSSSGEDKELKIQTDTSNDPSLFLVEGSAYTFGVNMTYDSSANLFKVQTMDNGNINEYLRIPRANGNLQIGDGTAQKNVTLTSPDGTEYNCGVANGGAFSCS